MPHIVDTAVKFIKSKVDVKDNLTAVILGSSYTDFLSSVEEKQEIFLRDIPNLKVLAEDAETNKFVFCKYKEKNLLILLGRLHYNYGYENCDIANLIFIIKELGCSRLIITASLGSLNHKMKVGDIVTATDHINLTGRNALYKCEYRKYGNLFIDMLEPYNVNDINTLVTIAKKEMGIKVKKGVLLELNGPSIETYGESKFARNAGADFSAFHICLEAIACKYCKLPVTMYGLITNYGSSFTLENIKHEDVVYNRRVAKNYYLELLRRYILSL